MSEGNPLAKGAAWMNGEIMPINEARLPVNDWGILHSDITYDVVPVRDGAFFRLPDYMERFRASRASLRLDIGMDEAAISAALHRMVAASGLCNSYVAMVASRGVPLFAAYYRRGQPKFVRAREIVQGGELGTVTSLSYTMTRPPFVLGGNVGGGGEASGEVLWGKACPVPHVLLRMVGAGRCWR